METALTLRDKEGDYIAETLADAALVEWAQTSHASAIRDQNFPGRRQMNWSYL